MQAVKRRSNFFDSDDGKDVKQKLEYLLQDKGYNTIPSYTADTVTYPDNQIPFVNRHMDYLNTHPNLDSELYLANIRLKTRIR